MATKKIKGIKRFILVDSLGIALSSRVETANVSEQYGAKALLSGLKPIHQKLDLIFADGGYLGEDLKKYLCQIGFELTVVKRKTKAFVILPKRWIVERTFGWFNRFRRLSKNFEVSVHTAELMIELVTIRILLRRLTT